MFASRRRLRYAQPDRVIGCANQILFRAQISFGRLHRRMPEQDLDLLKLTSGRAAQFRARPTKIVRGESGDSNFSRVLAQLCQTTFSPR